MKSEKGSKVFRTMAEIERHYFPKAFQHKLSVKKLDEPAAFGIGLANSFLEGIKRELSR